jgi:hypothetical protein
MGVFGLEKVLNYVSYQTLWICHTIDPIAPIEWKSPAFLRGLQ